MSEILLLDNRTKITFTKFPSYDEISLIKATCPKLRTVVFEGCIIPDFSLLKEFSGFKLVFRDSQVLDYSYPISLDSGKIYFINTVIDFERFFFMTNMPKLYDIALLYDSIEGVNLYKPYIHLLQFFPHIERVRLLTSTDKTYYDISHSKIYEEDSFGSNWNVLFAVNVWDSTRFLRYMPFYEFKGFDGTGNFGNEDFDIHRMCKRFWIDPKYMAYYNGLKYHDLKRVRETLVKLSKYSPDYRERLGRDIQWYDFSSDPLYSWPNLGAIITDRLKFRRLGSNIIPENEEPGDSSLYGLFGKKLYNTHGHTIIVNSRGAIICDYSEDAATKKLVNNLLPF